MRTAFSVVLPLAIIVMMVSWPQKVAEGHVRDARPVPPRYHVRGAEVNSLVDPHIDHQGLLRSADWEHDTLRVTQVKARSDSEPPNCPAGLRFPPFT